VYIPGVCNFLSVGVRLRRRGRPDRIGCNCQLGGCQKGTEGGERVEAHDDNLEVVDSK
jgi:hypothetical protein